MRKSVTVVIKEEGRDQGKAFLLTEMPATKAERWGIRAFLALAKSDVEVPDDVAALGLSGIAMLGLDALRGIEYEELAPLLDEMNSCIKAIPDPSNPEISRALVESDIEEVGTWLKLRKEVFKLHVDFSPLAAQLKSESRTAGESTKNTQTSQE